MSRPLRTIPSEQASTRVPSCASVTFSLPNALTFFRLGAAFVILLLFLSDHLWAVWTRAGLFVLAALTDFLDGYLARLYNQLSRLGRLLDPLADKLLVVPIMFVLVAKGTIGGLALVPAIIILIRELATPTLRERYVEMTHTALSIHKSAKWKTAFEMIAIACLMVNGPGNVQTLGFSILWVASFLGILSLCVYCLRVFRKL